MIGNSEIEVNPLRWRLDHKAALLQDDLSPGLLVEMSRESIRAMRSYLPTMQKLRKLAPGRYEVPIHEIDDLEQRRLELKAAAPDQYDIEEYVDHVVDTAVLMQRMTIAMDRFNEDHKDQVAAIEANNSSKGCLVAGLFLGASITSAALALRILV